MGPPSTGHGASNPRPVKDWLRWAILWAAFLGTWQAVKQNMPQPPWSVDLRQPAATPMPTLSLRPLPQPLTRPTSVGPDLESMAIRDSVPLPRSWKFQGSAKAWHDLATFFSRLESCDQNRIDIYHWGDSQIESDRITGHLRAEMQKRFGGRGPGWVLPRTPAPSFATKQVLRGSIERSAGYGRRRDTSALRLPFLAINRFRDSASWQVNANPIGHRTNRGWTRSRIWSSGASTWSLVMEDSVNLIPSRSNRGDQEGLWTWQHAGSTSGIELTGTANALMGAEFSTAHGVFVHNLPMRGGSGTLFDDVSEGDWGKLRTWTRPGLVILQFGGNAVPSLSSVKHAERYARRVADNIRHIRQRWPGVAVLFIGPSDMGDANQIYPQLTACNEALRTEVQMAGALMWDLREVMGGPGSMAHWMERGWAGEDAVHFSPRGAKEAGKRLWQALDHEHWHWQSTRRRPQLLVP